MKRPLKDAVAAGEPMVGTTLCLAGASVAELLAEPFDLVWVDLEHAALGPTEAQEVIVGAQAAGAYALVRLPADAYALTTVMLDAGADGVVLANIPDAATAQAAVTRTQYPPSGTRGFGPRRLALRGRQDGATRATPSVWVQIESDLDEHRLREIAAVPGVDMLIVGISDLSFALGTPLNIGSQPVREAVERVRKVTADCGVAFGLAGGLDADAGELAQGATVVVLGTDARLCAGAVDSAARQMRDILKIDSRESEQP